MSTNNPNTMVFAAADQMRKEYQIRLRISGKLNTTTKQTNSNKRLATISVAGDSHPAKRGRSDDLVILGKFADSLWESLL